MTLWWWDLTRTRSEDCSFLKPSLLGCRPLASVPVQHGMVSLSRLHKLVFEAIWVPKAAEAGRVQT